jgi:hypothetical protein
VRVPHFSKWIHSVGILYPGTTGHRLWPNNLVTTGSSSGKMVVGPNTRSKSLRPWPDDYGMWARKVSDQARRTFPNQRLHTRPTPISGGRRRRQGVPSTSTPHMGWLGGQVGPIPHSTDSRNLPKHLPPQRQELFKIGEKTIEASTDPDKPTFLARGLAGRVILPLM